jgi:hypothetical protein
MFKIQLNYALVLSPHRFTKMVAFLPLNDL